MKNTTTIRHNGKVHQIVEGLELFELSQGNITHELPAEADSFRFCVTGTDHNTGRRQGFKFILVATMRRSVRSDLDLTYIRNLIKETIEETLAVDNHFITGHLERGAQFDRAMLRHILSPNRIVKRVAGGHALAYDGKVNTDGLTQEEAAVKVAGCSFILKTKQGLFTYSIEDQVKWGVDDVVPVHGVALSPAIHTAVIEHFVKQFRGNVPYPITLNRVDGDRLIEAAVLKDNADFQFYTLATAHAKKVEVDDDYLKALDALDQKLRHPNVPRSAWATNTGPVAAIR